VPLVSRGVDSVVNYDDYAALRPSIAVPQNKLIPLDDRYGMHPALQPLQSWHESGNFSAVVATGLPAPNRSHFEAMDEIEQGVPGSSARSGWLNRVMGRHHSALEPLSALQVGSNTMPTAFQGDEPALGIRSLGSFTLDGTNSTFTRARWKDGLTKLSDKAPGLVREATRSTLGALDDVAAVAGTGSGSGYPNSATGKALQDVARLIKSDLGVKLVTLDVGNWDMHSGLGQHDRGWMRDNLTDLAASLAAFAADLGSKLADVTLVTISEFGRRVEENESGGLDHGWGNVMFVLGGHVATTVRGSWRGLTKEKMAQGDVYATTDYRAVLAEILAERCDADPADISAVFPGYSVGTYPGIISA
ncbi:MAG TPA: DUF1501 domain-containing protein, partial [Candidatus Nanopelagicales bacterium]|nr:DUF1501 domain-containing protein [Candidatus Nanopelagicales bacterium]